MEDMHVPEVKVISVYECEDGGMNIDLEVNDAFKTIVAEDLEIPESHVGPKILEFYLRTLLIEAAIRASSRTDEDEEEEEFPEEVDEEDTE